MHCLKNSLNKPCTEWCDITKRNKKPSANFNAEKFFSKNVTGRVLCPPCFSCKFELLTWDFIVHIKHSTEILMQSSIL